MFYCDIRAKQNNHDGTDQVSAHALLTHDVSVSD